MWAKLSYSKRWGYEEPEQRNQLDQPQSTRREVLDLGPGKGLSPGYQPEGVTDTGTAWSCCCPCPCCDVAAGRQGCSDGTVYREAVDRSWAVPSTALLHGQAFSPHLLLLH